MSGRGGAVDRGGDDGVSGADDGDTSTERDGVLRVSAQADAEGLSDMYDQEHAQYAGAHHSVGQGVVQALFRGGDGGQYVVRGYTANNIDI